MTISSRLSIMAEKFFLRSCEMATFWHHPVPRVGARRCTENIHSRRRMRSARDRDGHNL
jgi:hypothetical protein